MPEAEDVVLEAAERALHRVRRAWERGPAPGEDPADAFARERRRLDAWLCACFDRTWPMTPADAPLRPGWLLRALGRPPPWVVTPRAVASTDGHTIVLPRHPRRLRDGPGAEMLRLITALGLGVRLERDAASACPPDPVARDVFWSLEGALADARLARDLPGLAAAVGRAREAALRARPAAARLRPSERAVEGLVRLLLSRDPSGTLATIVPDGASPSAVHRFAERFAAALAPGERARHRGMAPVDHWGAPPGSPPGPPALLHRDDTVASSSPRSRTLSRRVAPRSTDAEELDGRPGPFVLPFGDPQASVQDPAGIVRPVDQGDEADLEALADEFARLERAPRVVSDAPVREVLAGEDEPGVSRAGAPSRTATGPDGPAFVYPEWDFRRGAYRAGHCRVYERPAPVAGAREVTALLAGRAGAVRALRRRFEALRPRRSRRSRQLEGDGLDLDAWCQDWSALRAGRSPDGRTYTISRRERREVAVTLLLDASGSTDTWVSGHARVIDVEKDAVLCFCEALSALGDRHAVLAFSGRGPRQVRLLRVKGFGEALDGAVRGRIAALDPDGFTRLGAALRHATAGLARAPARARFLLVLSDAKPYDEDEYAGAYGIEDARQAVAEAALAGIRVFCVNVDRTGPTHLARVFGLRGFTTLWNVAQLPRRLPELYRHLTVGL